MLVDAIICFDNFARGLAVGSRLMTHGCVKGSFCTDPSCCCVRHRVPSGCLGLLWTSLLNGESGQQPMRECARASLVTFTVSRSLAQPIAGHTLAGQQ